FKDVYLYTTVDPSTFGNMYSILDSTTGALTVRSGNLVTTSNDVVNVTRSGNILTVSIDLGTDPGGVGSLPGTGALPAWVTTYDLSSTTVTSIAISTGNGNDTINLGAGLGVPVSIAASNGTDNLNLTGTSGVDTFTIDASNIDGPGYDITGYTNVENTNINAGDGADVFDMNALSGTRTIFANGEGGNDTVNVTNATFFNPRFNGGTGANFFNLNSGDLGYLSDLGASSTDMTVNVNAGTFHFHASQRLTALNVASGARADMVANGNNVMRTALLSISGTGILDLQDNDMILDYTAGSPLSTVESLIASGRNFGAWDGPGITSTVALNDADSNTTLGTLEGSDYIAVSGGSTFDAQTIDSTTVVVKYTYYGDSDFSGNVTLDDYANTDGGFLLSSTGWLNGDFDGSGGSPDLDDYSLIDGAFLTQAGVIL
ncbi:MAG: hypothetical protein ACREJC_08865, partial [Tepidisphaeraceae bacterium]